jgi:sugar/nucleoside kinase (ribokinase family)
MDIAVCGNLTIDELVQGGRIRISPGGSALFSSCAAAYLGTRVRIVGNVGQDYPRSNLRRLRTMRISLHFLRKNAGPSTRFQIARINGSRRLRLIEPGDQVLAPRSPRRFQGVHMGPVFNEISNSLVNSLRKRCDFLSADLQGFIRIVSGGVVRTVPRNLNRLLSKCDMVQASVEEARTKTRLRDPKAMLSRFLKMRVQFSIVTMGGGGSWLGSRRDGSYFVPAFPDRSIRDSTGAGDIFAGSWLSTYLSTKDPVWASAVGSAFASLASHRTGLSKFRLSRRELFHRASWVYNHVEPVKNEKRMTHQSNKLDLSHLHQYEAPR